MTTTQQPAADGPIAGAAAGWPADAADCADCADYEQKFADPERVAPQVLADDAAKPVDQRAAERGERIRVAALNGQPDRVPVFIGAGYLVTEMGGVTRQESYADPDLALELLLRAATYFQPDAMAGPWHSPEPSKALGDRSTRWPGHGLGPDGSFQYAEAEFMKADDYDDFLEDPTDWALRVYLPRVFEKLEPLANLPHFGMASFGYYNLFSIAPMASPEMLQAMIALGEAARQQLAFDASAVRASKTMVANGFGAAPRYNFLVEAPFDYMSDTLRGMKGIFLDLRQRPEKLLAAQEKAIRIQLRAVKDAHERYGQPAVFIPLHRGSDGFMSLKQFDRFYWPQFEEFMLGLIDLGVTPWVFYEGVWDQRLEYLTRLPAGKSVGLFQNSDLIRAKEIVGDTMCIMGGMPVSLLRSGSREQIRERTHEVCERVGAGGGLIMSTSVRELESCDPVRVRTWTDATREFGVYA
jgi:uroporphyrinogen-III decarboxylase